MKLFQLINELNGRNIELSICEDGRLRVAPIEKAKDLLDEIKFRKTDVIFWLKGKYDHTSAENVAEFVRLCGDVYWSDVSDRFTVAAIKRAKSDRLVVEQVNGWFRLPCECEVNVEPYRRRKVA